MKTLASFAVLVLFAVFVATGISLAKEGCVDGPAQSTEGGKP